MADSTARLGLPLLIAGQGQKDITHNEALFLLDTLVQASVLSRAVGVPPATPVAGQCWIIPATATGEWEGRGNQLAAWTEGGWRYLPPRTAMLIRVQDENADYRFDGAAWLPAAPFGAPAPVVAPPSGGSVVDVEARAAILSLIDRLKLLRLIN